MTEQSDCAQCVAPKQSLQPQSKFIAQFDAAGGHAGCGSSDLVQRGTFGVPQGFPQAKEEGLTEDELGASQSIVMAVAAGGGHLVRSAGAGG